jgi:hypothetical protein
MTTSVIGTLTDLNNMTGLSALQDLSAFCRCKSFQKNDFIVS